MLPVWCQSGPSKSKSTSVPAISPFTMIRLPSVPPLVAPPAEQVTDPPVVDPVNILPDWFTDIGTFEMEQVTVIPPPREPVEFPRSDGHEEVRIPDR